MHPLQMLGRALRIRCPRCGGGPLFRHWLAMRETCPVCGLRLERGEQGYQVGSYMFNIVLSELLFALAFVIVVALTWPAPPWTLLQYGGAIMMVILPFLLFPWCRTLFLALDLMIRPDVDTPDMPWEPPEESVEGREKSGKT